MAAMSTITAAAVNGAPTADLLSAGTVTITVANAPGVLNGAVVDGQTALAFGVPIFVNGHTISDHYSNSLVLLDDGSTIPFTHAPRPTYSLLAAGSVTIEAYSTLSGHVLVNGETLSPGGSALRWEGVTITDGVSGLIAIDSSGTQPFMSAPTIPALAPGAELLAAEDVSVVATPLSDSGAYIINGETLTPGGSDLTISREQVISDSSGHLVILPSTFGSPITLSTVTREPEPKVEVLNLEGSRITAVPIPSQPGAWSVASTSLTPGGNAALIDGKILSDASGFLVEVAASTTSTLSTDLVVSTCWTSGFTSAEQTTTWFFYFPPAPAATQKTPISRASTGKVKLGEIAVIGFAALMFLWNRTFT